MKIVVRGTNWIGDAVMSIPGLRRLRGAFPGAHIALHTRAWAEGIFRDAEFIDEIVAFDKSRSKVSDTLGESKRLRKLGFDMAVLFTNSFETALVAKLAGIPRRAGYAKEGRALLLTDAFEVPAWKETRHESFYYLNLIAGLDGRPLVDADFDVAALDGTLAVSPERREAARLMLAAAGVDPSKKTVALGAGSTNSRAKRWPAERYAILGDLIQNELDANVVLVGASDELEVSRAVVEAAKRKPVVLTGRTNLAEAVAVLAEVDALVSNDMGLAHVAPATGTKTLVIFGPTKDATTRPLGADIIRKPVDCAPCMLRDCPIDHRCMTEIAPEEVLEKVARMLE